LNSSVTKREPGNHELHGALDLVALEVFGVHRAVAPPSNRIGGR